MRRGFRVALLLWLTFAVTAHSDSGGVLQPRSLGEFDYDWYGSVSPDGRFLTYVEWETGDLFLRDLSTGEKRNLTRKQGTWEYDLPPESRHTASNAFAIFSAISPDGKQVAYTWFDERKVSLRLVNVDASGQRVLHQSDEVISYEPHDWSLDGKRILVTLIRRDGRNQAVLLSTADGSTELVREFVGLRTPLRMKFSPDGRYIAYDFPAQEDSHDWEVFVMSAEGRNSARMVQHRGNDLLIGWAPDGKSLVFQSDRAGTPGVWLQTVLDGKPRNAPKLVKGNLGPIFFSLALAQGSLYYGVSDEFNELYVAELHPGSTKSSGSPKLLGQIGGSSSADWSPDGTKLVYPVRFGPVGTAYTAYSWALVIRDGKSGAERKVPIALSRWGPFQPRWSPDGRWLLASGWDARGLQGVYRIDSETGKVTPVVQQNGRGDSRMFTVRSAVWSADGKTIFYRRTSGGRVSILARRFDTEEEKDLVGAELPASELGGLAVSPDGRWLAFVLGSEPGGLSALQLMPAGGGSARELLTLRSPDTITQLAWMPDGNSIVFGKGIRTGERGRFELWRISREGGSPKSLGIAMDDRTLVGLSIHPDGNRVAFAAQQQFRSELWVLNDFLGQQPRTDK